MNVQKTQIVTPPNRLRPKVSGSGPISPEMVTRAKEAVASLAPAFAELMAKDVAKVAALYAEGLADPSRRLEIAKAIFEVTHDLRGQAGTFDYPLITRVGSSLCRFIENLKECDDACFEVIGVHVEALDGVLRNAIRGDGGPLGREIANGLELAVKKVLS
jgi:hypothetical protein